MKHPSQDSLEHRVVDVVDFARLQVGHVYGVHELLLSSRLVDNWCRLYRHAMRDDRMPAGMMSVVSIRAFMALIPSRPPGGIHAGQQFTIEELPRVGELLHTQLCCVRKEARQGRLWVDLEMECRGADGRALFRGKHIALWAR